MQIAILNLGGLTVGACALAIVWFYFHKAGKARFKRITTRPEMNMHQIYESYFSNTEITEARVAELFTDLARTLELPPGKLLPTDRFRVELAPEKGFEFDDPINNVLRKINLHCQRIGTKPETIQTVKDYVQVFGHLRREN